MSVKILVLADIHNQEITLRSILQSLEKINEHPDYCVIAGDITNFGTIQDLENMVNLIVMQIPKTFYVVGNCDPLINNNSLNSDAINVDAKIYEIEFFSIIGFGTHKPILDRKKIKKLHRTNKQVCLLTHTPPFNTAADIVSLNRHAGSKQIRECIEKNNNIFLSISGHIHDSPTISELNGCIIVNPGSVTTGNFAIIEVQTNFKVKGKIYNLHEL